jgi:hypothetical protein
MSRRRRHAQPSRGRLGHIWGMAQGTTTDNAGLLRRLSPDGSPGRTPLGCTAADAIPSMACKGSGVQIPSAPPGTTHRQHSRAGPLSADCQQITPCGRNNALSAARFRRLQPFSRGGIRRKQGQPGHGRGPAPAAELTVQAWSARSVVQVVAEELGPSLRWATATATRATRSQDQVASSIVDATSGTRSMPALRSVVSVLVSFVGRSFSTNSKAGPAGGRLRRLSSAGRSIGSGSLPACQP